MEDLEQLVVAEVEEVSPLKVQVAAAELSKVKL